jgi:hypothetical protein
MSGYLDQYGVQDARKEKFLKRFVISIVAIVVLGGMGFFYFRTWSEERTLNEFFATLDRKDYPNAYRMFGCAPEKPCDNYDLRRFNEDWGPETPYAQGSAAKIENVDFCDNGVVFLVNYPKGDPLWLWVERSTKVISFAPWPRCPGRHLQLRSFFGRLFSKS